MRSHCQLCVSSTVAAVAVAVEPVAFVGLMTVELDESAGLGFAGPVSAVVSAKSTAGELVVSLGLALAELVSPVVFAELAAGSAWLVSAWPPLVVQALPIFLALDSTGPTADRWHHLSQPSPIFFLGYRMHPSVFESRRPLLGRELRAGKWGISPNMVTKLLENYAVVQSRTCINRCGFDDWHRSLVLCHSI
jgi:hypothetical protein